MKAILLDKKGLKHWIGLRHFYAKPDRTLSILFTYVFFVSLTFLALEFTAFQVLREQGDQGNLIYSTYGLLGILIFMWTLVVKSDPGYLEKDPQMDFKTLLATFCPRGLCPTCKLINTPRSFHCMVCNKCVERFDHHCPWIDNCVGHNNFVRFYIYLLVQFAYLVIMLIVVIKSMKIDISQYSEIADMESETGVSESGVDIRLIMRCCGNGFLLLLCLPFTFLVL
mmetsp:Transcript_29318/g.34387  ORF Transcript_29318/g.34387 Transcript_29318/m.34387 type:complete len:225 (+) Transcript_29318:27-701(+)